MIYDIHSFPTFFLTVLDAGGCERYWNWSTIYLGKGEAITEAKSERTAAGETCQQIGWLSLL